MTEKRSFHPVSDGLPLMSKDELQRLATSIKTYGLRMPIIVDAEGRIIDGRCRYLACQIAGVEPTFRTDTSDPRKLVISYNIMRASYGTVDRVFAAAKSWDWAKVEEAKRSEYLATLFGVKARDVEQARFLLIHEPSVVRRVMIHALRLREAYEAARRRHAEREARPGLLARVKAQDEQLEEMVRIGKVTLEEALAELRERDLAEAR